MPGVDAATGTLTVPIWAAGAVCGVVVVALLLAVKRAGGAMLISSLFRVGIVAAAVYGAWIYVQRSSMQDQAAERRSLEERSAALVAHAVAPGSALACLDEIAGQPVGAACEKGVFANPEAVAASVSYVTAKLALLTDSSAHIREIDPAFAAELAPMRAALELDRFGIVAHVLSLRDGCTADKCDALARFKDSSHVLANLRDRPFEDAVAKYTAMWNVPVRAEAPVATVAAAPAAAPPTNLTPPPSPVSPRYDFPSSQSIPAVSIMANEPPAPRTPASAPAPSDPGVPVTPVPPRRPPQVRTGSTTPPPPRPARPPAAPDPDSPGDAAVPRGNALAPR
jgi:hypothetical protein